MIKAEWGTDYDWRNDKCFSRPMHKECNAPILFEDGKYWCICCGEEAELQQDMKKWIDESSGEKTKVEKCFSCGKNTMVVHYHRNPNTKEWETGFYECECGIRFIV